MPAREEQRRHEELLELPNGSGECSAESGRLNSRSARCRYSTSVRPAPRLVSNSGLEHEIGAQRRAEQARELLRERVAAEDGENALAVLAQAQAVRPAGRVTTASLPAQVWRRLPSVISASASSANWRR